jgi:3-phenylpropionate/cinnamic acid dioxygenase small subunit
MSNGDDKPQSQWVDWDAWIAEYEAQREFRLRSHGLDWAHREDGKSIGPLSLVHREHE